ncbi:MAG: hypothetical protein ACKO37_06160 [Vampirovibrionales bacterium]
MMCFYSTKQGHRRFIKDGFEGSIYDCPVHGAEAKRHQKDHDDHEASVKRLAKTGIQNAQDQRDALRVFEYFKHVPRNNRTSIWEDEWKEMPLSRVPLHEAITFGEGGVHNPKLFRGLMSELLPDDLEHTLPFNALPMTKEEREYAEMLELAKLLNIPESKLAAWIDTVPELIGNPDFPSHELFQKFHPSFRSIRTMEVRPQQPLHGLSLSELLDIANHLPGFQEDRQRWIASNPQTHKGIITDAQGYGTHTLEQPYRPHGPSIVNFSQPSQHPATGKHTQQAPTQTHKSSPYPNQKELNERQRIEKQSGEASVVGDGLQNTNTVLQELIKDIKKGDLKSIETHLKFLQGAGYVLDAGLIIKGIKDDIALDRTPGTVIKNALHRIGSVTVSTIVSAIAGAGAGAMTMNPLILAGAAIAGDQAGGATYDAIIPKPTQHYNYESKPKKSTTKKPAKPPTKQPIKRPSTPPHKWHTSTGSGFGPAYDALFKQLMRAYTPEEVEEARKQLRKKQKKL